MAKGSVQVSKDLKSPTTQGTYYRLIGLSGQNKGTCYYLKGGRVVIGRGEQADIQIMDSKASREHAELTKVKNEFIVTDLGSQNGIIVNDLKVSQYHLSDGDRIIIGQTIFKFQIITILATELPSLKTSENFAQDKDDEDLIQDSKKKEVAPRSMKKLLVMGAVIAIGIIALTTSPPKVTDSKDGKTTKPESKEGEKRIVMKPRGETEEERENDDKIKGLLQQGQRELREANYYRAITAFQLATNLDPQNGYAQYYLNKSRQSLDQEVKDNFFRAALDVEALKYRSAIVAYCSVMRLLQQYNTDQRYKDAQTNIELLEEKLGMEKGETKCFEGQ